jgi:prepilin-type N-terminal cleavage/methylation domain-containing protein
MKNSCHPALRASRRRNERGFTLIEMLMAIVVLLVGIIAVAQLVPASIGSNSTNRNDSSALVFAQREMNVLRGHPITDTLFTDPLGVSCPLAITCDLGNPALPGQTVGGPVVLDISGRPVIDFGPVNGVANYSFTYPDPNDPYGTSYDVRWAVITTTKNNVATAKRFIVGVQKRSGNGFFQPITLDTMVER